MEHIDPLLKLFAFMIMLYLPGPTTSLIISETFSNGTKNGVGVVLAIALFPLLYLVLLELGLKGPSPILQNIVRQAATAYLFYMAYSAIWGRRKKLEGGKRQHKPWQVSFLGALVVVAGSTQMFLVTPTTPLIFLLEEQQSSLFEHRVLEYLPIIVWGLLIDCIYLFAATKGRNYLQEKGKDQMISIISSSLLGMSAVTLVWISLNQ